MAKVYKGPVQPGVDEEHFRKTGESKPEKKVYVGPVQPGVDEEYFRETGISRPEGGSSAPPRTPPPKPSAEPPITDKPLPKGLTPEQESKIISERERIAKTQQEKQALQDYLSYIGSLPPSERRQAAEDIGRFGRIERLKEQHLKEGTELRLTPEASIFYEGLVGSGEVAPTVQKTYITLPEQAPGYHVRGLLTSAEEFRDVSIPKESIGTTMYMMPSIGGFEYEAKKQEPTVTYDIPKLGIIPTKTTMDEPPGLPESAFISPQGTVEPVIEKKDIGIIPSIKKYTEKEKRERDIGFGKGVVLGAVGTTVVGVEGIATLPKAVATTKVFDVSPDVGQRLKEAGPSFGRTLRTDTGIAVGMVAAEVALFKGFQYAPRLIQKGTDIYRTRGLKEIGMKEVIAPEYFAGQRWPAMRRGQTIGELQKEFRAMLPGEVRPAGYTAYPRPLAEGPVQAGKSAFPGIYQAPELSPHFLRVTEGERKVFGLNPFDTFRPTAHRITPKSFKLVPSVSPTEKRPLLRAGRPKEEIIRLRRERQEFFKTAPKGYSYIPFEKTEKESILVFGTPIKETRERFFFKFEGRRIPIKEYEVVDVTGKTKGLQELPTVDDISRSISESRIGRRGIITPYEIGYGIRRTTKSPRRIKKTTRKRDTPVIKPPRVYGPPTYTTPFKPGRYGDPYRRRSTTTTGPPPIIIPFDTPPPPDGKKQIFKIPDIDFAGPEQKYPIFKRKLQRTPSFGQALRLDLGLPTLKKPLPEKVERTGLAPRAFVKPQRIKPLGPLEI